MKKLGLKWLAFLGAVLLAFIFTGCAETEESDETSYSSLMQRTIRFDANGGAIGASSDTQVVTTEKSIWPLRTAADLNLTRLGHTFVGWKSAADSEIILYKDGEELNFNDSYKSDKYSFFQELSYYHYATLYAAWEETICTITFNANGGNIATSEQGVGASKTVNLKSIEDLGLYRLGYTFVGWSLSPDAVDATYANQAYALFESNVTLYALWKENPKRTVTFNANGGNIVTASQTVVEQVPTPLSSANSLGLAREGYIFAGWGKSASDKTVTYADGQKINLPENSGNITLYALWAYEVSYNITFNVNGGSATKTTQVMTGKTIAGEISAKLSTANSLNLTRTGYKFKGWALTSSAKSAKYSDGESITIAADTTVYAVWDKIVTYTITYNANGGTISGSTTITVTGTESEGAVHTLKTSSTASRSGYVLSAWSSGSKSFSPGTSVTVTGNATFTAVWILPTYTITYVFDKQSYGQLKAPQTTRTVTGAKTITLPTASSLGYTKSGYEFLGWSTSQSSTSYYPAGNSITISKDTKLYGVWKEICIYVQLYHPGYQASTGAKFGTMAVAVGRASNSFSLTMRNGTYTTAYTKLSGVSGSQAWATSFTYQKTGYKATTVSKSGYATFVNGGKYKINVTTGAITKMN